MVFRDKQAIVGCEWKVRESMWDDTYDLSTIGEIKFSSNDPVLLGSFTCVDIDVADSYNGHLRPDLVDIKIYELFDVTSKNESGDLLLEMKAEYCNWERQLFFHHSQL